MIVPVKGKLVIKPMLAEEQRTAGGIIIDSVVTKVSTTKGVVIESNSSIAGKDAIVIFKEFAPDDVLMSDGKSAKVEKLWILDESDILAVEV